MAAVLLLGAWFPHGSGGGSIAPTVSSVTISGSTVAGNTLTCSATVTGNPSPTLTYAWTENSSTVGRYSTYITGSGDVGNTLTCTETATNVAGNASSTSPSFGPISSGYTIAGISLTSTTTSGAANAQVGCVMITTSPVGQAWTGPVTLGGTNASDFTMTNGGMNPTCLNVGSSQITGAPKTDAITLTATQ